jgi:membrane protein YqaA with SNARE-associated domain
MFTPAKKVYNWASAKANTPLAPLWLGIVFLLEMVLFIPLDALLMLFCLENPKRRFLYALIATVASMISGIIGYFLGLFLWDIIGPYIVGHLISTDFFNRLVLHYTTYESWAVLIGSALPVPFKAITLSAGFCKIAFLPFIACVCAARAFRFFLLAELMHLWGVKIKAFIDRHFNRILVAVGAKIAIGLTFFWALSH